MRFQRHCYNKMWRCPGWAGGGWSTNRFGRDKCDGGSFARKYMSPGWRWYTNWQFHRCDTCGTVAIPHVTRWLDPTWYRWGVNWDFKQRFQDWRYLRQRRKGSENDR